MPSKTKKSSKGARKLNQTIRIPISRSSELSKYGYKNIRKTSEKKRRESLVRFITSVGDDKEKQIKKAGKVIQKLNALAIVQKNRQPEFSRRVRRDQKYVSRLLLNLKKGEMIGKGLIRDPETGLPFDTKTGDLLDLSTGMKHNKYTGITSRKLEPQTLSAPPKYRTLEAALRDGADEGATGGPDSGVFKKEYGGDPTTFEATGTIDKKDDLVVGERIGGTTGPGLADPLPPKPSKTTGLPFRLGPKRRTRRNK